MATKRRLAGVAAGCAVAVATLAGAPAASADLVDCVKYCEPGTNPSIFNKWQPASVAAFAKIEFLGDPGLSGDVFNKFDEFYKLD